MALGPSKYGYLKKKSNSWWASILPCLFPLWKTRFFVLVGNFLIRYPDEQPAQSPKGLPIPLDAVQISRVDNVTIQLKMISKSYFLMADSEESCTVWQQALVNRKSQAIREQMGHAPLDSRVDAVNKAATKLFLEKLDRQRHEQHHYNDMLYGQSTLNPLQTSLNHDNY